MKTLSIWKNLNNKDMPLMRKYKAQLKRSKTLDEIMLHPYFQTVRLQNQDSEHPITLIKLAISLGLLAHISNDKTDAPVGATFAAKVKEYRFRKVLSYNLDSTDSEYAIEANRFFHSVRALVSICDNTISITNLTKSIRFWNNRTKQEWAYDYYTNLK